MTIPKGIKVVAPKYDKSYDERVIQLAKQGATIAIMADDIGVSIDQLKEWERTKKSFKEAMAVAMTSSRAFHEKRLIESYNNKDSNSTLIQSLLKANFGDVYQTSTYQPAGKNGGKNNEPLNEIDYQGEITKLLESLRSSDEQESKPVGKMVGRKDVVAE